MSRARDAGALAAGVAGGLLIAGIVVGAVRLVLARPASPRFGGPAVPPEPAR